MRITSNLYSLCICNNCTVCSSCIIELQNHQITTCPFCRDTLDFNVEIDRKGQLKYIGMLCLFLILILVFEIILPSILICHESKDRSDSQLNMFSNNALIVTLILISVLLLQPITYSIDKITQHNAGTQNNYYIKFVEISLGYNILVDILFLTVMKYNIHFYYVFLVIFPIFLVPFSIKFGHMLYLFLFSQMSCYSRNYRLNRIVPIEQI